MAFFKCQILLYATSIVLLCCTTGFMVESSGINKDLFIYPNGSLACKQYDITSLDCSYRKLTSIPAMNNNATTLLSLNFNSIANIKGKPFQHLPKLHTLSLVNNNISIITNDAFFGLSLLESLDLRWNGRENLRIIGEPFAHTESLRLLDLSHNAISNLSSAVFNGLHSLIQTLPDDVFSELHNLEELDLSTNFFYTIPSRAIAPLFSLRKLTMLWCVITFPDFGAGFKNPSNLTELTFTNLGDLSPAELPDDTFVNLSNSTLSRLSFVFPWGTNVSEKLFAPLNKVTSLQLTATIQSIFACGSLESELDRLVLYDLNLTILNDTSLKSLAKFNSTLVSMTISGNQFVSRKSLQGITGRAFYWFPNLAELSLKSNNIRYLTEDAFFGLNRLIKLDLSDNDFKLLPTNELDFFSNFQTLLHLDISQNRLGGTLYLDDLGKITTLQHLHLGRNALNVIAIRSDRKLLNISRLYLDRLRNHETLDIQFDFRQLPSLTIFVLPRNDDGYFMPHASMCQPTNHMTHIDLTNWKFLSQVELRAFMGPECKYLETLVISGTVETWNDVDERIISVPRLKTLKMANNRMTLVSQLLQLIKAPNGLNYLDLSNNDIQSIDVRLDEILPNLLHLNLESNHIKYLQYIPNTILYLKMAKNSLTDIPHDFLSAIRDPSTDRHFDLGDNPFDCSCGIEPFLHCSCDIQQFQRWIKLDIHTFLEPQHMYQCKTPKNKTGLSLTQVDLDCELHITLYLAIGVPCALLLLAALIILVCYRKHIKFKLYLMYHQRRYRRNKSRVEPPLIGRSEEVNQFHSYVIFHKEAEDWVHDELIPNIEEAPSTERFTLCLKERRDTPGGYLLNSICYGIKHSYKTIAVLTKSFLKDGLCDFQLQIAQMRLIAESQDVLIPVVLEDLPDADKSLLIRKVMRDKDSLEWLPDGLGQKLFWERLRDELNKPATIDRRYEEV